MTTPADEKAARAGYQFDDEIPQDLRVPLADWAEKHDLRFWRVWWYELSPRQKVSVPWVWVWVSLRLLMAAWVRRTFVR